MKRTASSAISSTRASSVRKTGPGQSPGGGKAHPPCIARISDLRLQWLELAEFLGRLANNRSTRAMAVAIGSAFTQSPLREAARALHCAGHGLQGVAEDDALNRGLVSFCTATEFFLDESTDFSPAALAQDTHGLIEEERAAVGFRQRMSMFHGRPDDETMNRRLGLGWNLVCMAAKELVSASEALYNGIYEGILGVKLNGVPILLRNRPLAEEETCMRLLAARMETCSAAVADIAGVAYDLEAISEDIRRITAESTSMRQQTEARLKDALASLAARIGHCPPAFSRCTVESLMRWPWKGVHRVPYTPSLRDHGMWAADTTPAACRLMMPAQAPSDLPLWLQEDEDTVQGVWLLTLVAVGDDDDDDDMVPQAALDAYERACNAGTWGCLLPCQCLTAPICDQVRIVATLHRIHNDIGAEAWMASSNAHIRDIIGAVPLCCRTHVIRAEDARAGAALAEHAAGVIPHCVLGSGVLFYLGANEDDGMGHGSPCNILVAGACASAELLLALHVAPEHVPAPQQLQPQRWGDCDAVIITKRGVGAFAQGYHLVYPHVKPVLDDDVYAKYASFFSAPPIARRAHSLDGGIDQPAVTIYSCARSVPSCTGPSTGIRACVTVVQAVRLVIGIYEHAGSEGEALAVLGPLPQDFLKAVAPTRVGSGAAMLLAINVRMLEEGLQHAPTVAQAAVDHDSVLTAAVDCIITASSTPVGRPVDAVEEALAQLHRARLLNTSTIRALLRTADDCCVMPAPPMWNSAASDEPEEGFILTSAGTWPTVRHVMQHLGVAYSDSSALEEASNKILGAHVLTVPTRPPGCSVEAFVQGLEGDEAHRAAAVRDAVETFLSDYLEASTVPDVTRDGCGYIFSQACARALLLLPPRDCNFIRAVSHQMFAARKSVSTPVPVPNTPSYGAGVATDVLDNFIGALNWLALRQTTPVSFLNGIGLSRQHHTAAVMAVVYARAMGVRRPLSRQAIRFVAPSCAAQGFLAAVENEMFERPWTITELENGRGPSLMNAIGSSFAAQGNSQLCLVDSAEISLRLFGRVDLSCTEQYFFADWRETDTTPPLRVRVLSKHRGLTPAAAAAITEDVMAACDRRALCKFVTGRALSGAEKITMSLCEFGANAPLPSAATCSLTLNLADYWAEVAAGRQSHAWLMERLKRDLGMTLSLSGPGFSLA